MPGDMFDKVDTNKDGEITGEEIVQYTLMPMGMDKSLKRNSSRPA